MTEAIQMACPDPFTAAKTREDPSRSGSFAPAGRVF